MTVSTPFRKRRHMKLSLLRAVFLGAFVAGGSVVGHAGPQSPPGTAVDLVAVDRALTEHVRQFRGAGPTAASVLEQAVKGVAAPGKNESIRARWEVSTALDQVGVLERDPKSISEAAALLVELLDVLASTGHREDLSGMPNATAALRSAIWDRSVRPLEERFRAIGPVPIAAPGQGRLIAQWVVPGARKNTVRALDLWAEKSRLTLTWSIAGFEEAFAKAETLTKRGMVETDPAPGARLALYVDLAAVSPSERSRLTSAARREGAGNLRFVLDDTHARAEECKAARIGAKLPEAANGPAGGRLRGATDPTEAGGDQAGGGKEATGGLVDVAEEQKIDKECRATAKAGGIAGHAVLFDIGRRLKIQDLDLETNEGRVDPFLARALQISKVWP